VYFPRVDLTAKWSVLRALIVRHVPRFIVILNSFQDLRRRAERAERWMLKHVQHDVPN